VIVRGGDDGNGRATSQAAAEEQASAEWVEARRMEDSPDQAGQAANAYARIASQAKGAPLQAVALQAQARCLVRAGNKPQASEVLAALASQAAYRHCLDSSGRLIAPASALGAIQLAGEPNSPAAARLVGALARRLNDYGDAMPAAQRRFLMHALIQAAPSAGPFDTLAAEDLAAEYVDYPQPPAETGALSPSATPGLWHRATGDGSAVLLYRESRLLADMAAEAKTDQPFIGAATQLSPPGAGRAGQEPFVKLPASPYLPGWTLEVYLPGDDPFAEATRRQTRLYLTAAAVSIVVLAALATAVTVYVGRQIRLTRLKNDLIATVSHELKTPLASMRVLVDTLLEGRCRDEGQARDYFQLLARENLRLTALIDNFLNFSRMERNKKAFVMEPLHMGDVVTPAIHAVSERFNAAGCQFTLALAHGLPDFDGDRDALITVALNLLDNAWKYTGPDKRITLRTFARDGEVCLEVSDNGIGLTRRQARRIFDRFYQADQSLSRRAGGCGLGLSIVKFIVDAHGGKLSVVSQLNKGSTFIVRLPASPGEGSNS
jgi:signal transduction histidine kinase